MWPNKNEGPKMEDERVSKLLESVEALTKTVATLSGGFNTLQQSQQQLNTNLTSVAQQIGGQQAPVAPVKEDTFKSLDQYTAEELEQIPENQRLAIQREDTMRMIQESIKGVVTPVQKELQSFQQKTYQSNAQADLQRVMGEKDQSGKLVRPDFKDFLSDMVKLKGTPGMENLGTEQLYILAKGSNPIKAAELNEKYNPKQDVPPSTYGGILGSVAPQSADKGDLSLEDASKEALKEFAESEGSLLNTEADIIPS